MAFSKESILILFLVHCLRCCGGFAGSGSGSGDGRCRWSRRRRCPTLALPLVKPDQKLLMGENLMNKSNAKSILIVENDDNLRKAIGKFLAKGGYHVTGVSDARSAMLVCRGIVRPVNSSRTRLKLDPNVLRQPAEVDIDNNSTKSIIPDCLVLDIQLSGSMDGLGLLKIIRADPVLASLPVVLLTAKGKVEDRIIGYERDADVYLPKPFEPAEVLSIIDGLLRRDKYMYTRKDAKGTTEQYGNRKTNSVYGDLKRELMEIKTLLNLNAPTDGMSVVTGNSLQRDISEIKDKLKDLVDQTPQHAKPMKDQYDTLSILSPVETQIMHLVAKGMTTKAIAGEMECSISKIEKHITSLLKKANVKNRIDLVDWWKTYSGTIKDFVPKVVDASSSKQISKDNSDLLTTEETVVMELLESGLTTEEIISKTQSSKKRISLQLSSLFDKAGVRNRTELVRWWREGGKSTAS